MRDGNSRASWYASMSAIFPSTMRRRRKQKGERQNSARERAHRLDNLLREPLPDTSKQRVNAILHMADVYRSGWITCPNFLNLVRDIVKEDNGTK